MKKLSLSDLPDRLSLGFLEALSFGFCGLLQVGFDVMAFFETLVFERADPCARSLRDGLHQDSIVTRHSLDGWALEQVSAIEPLEAKPGRAFVYKEKQIKFLAFPFQIKGLKL